MAPFQRATWNIKFTIVAPLQGAASAVRARSEFPLSHKYQRKLMEENAIVAPLQGASAVQTRSEFPLVEPSIAGAFGQNLLSEGRRHRLGMQMFHRCRLAVSSHFLTNPTPATTMRDWLLHALCE